MSLIVALSPFILLGIICGATADEVCHTKEQRIICQYDIPKSVPPGVTEVYVENHKDINLTSISFSNPSWKNILTLQIYQNKERTSSVYISSNAFHGLDNLNVLGIHSRGFGRYTLTNENNIFQGLVNITELDFSGCVNLKGEAVMSSLMQHGEFTKLRTLNLDEVNTDLRYIYLDISQSFANMLISKRIENLSLRKTNIALYPLEQNISSTISHLDISDTTFQIDKPDVFRKQVPLNFLYFLKNVKSLNISQLFPTFWRGQSIRVSNLHLTNCIKIAELFLINLFYIENLYANDILSDASPGGEIINTTVNLTCNMNLRILQLRGNNLNQIRATFRWPDKNFLWYIDLTNNKISYLSPNTTKGLTNLKTVLLGENRLSEMSSSPEFIDVFANKFNLERLVLDKNGFSYLPESTFLHNKLLTYLSLKGNRLKQVTFETNHLKKLKVLDLSDNLIHIFDEQSMHRINNVILLKTNFSLHLKGNPIECSCKSESFVEWIHKHSVYVSGYGTVLNCTLENKVVIIDDKTVAKTRFICIRTLVYVSISSAAVLAIVVFTVLFIAVSKLIKRRRNTDQVQRFLRNYRKKQVNAQFLCLLSYSNEDSDVAIEHIYTNFNETFKQITGLESDAVCIDERHFHAGAEIVAEIMRCISDSCVIVFLVSRSFCESNWCCLEIKEAYEQQKPIVLVFAEDVDENEMPAYLKQMFQRYTRAKIVKQDEGVNVQPGGWEGLCESIILLASRQFTEEKTQQ